MRPYAGNKIEICKDFSSFVSAVIFPPWAATVEAAMDNPSPYPPVSEFLELSVR